MIRTTVIVALTVLLSKALGFVREMILAARFGAGSQTDAFVMAYGIFFVPILLYGSAISSTVVPMYTRISLTAGEDAARGFSARIFWIFAALGAATGLIMAALSPQLTRIFAVGFDAQRAELTAKLMRAMMPALACFVPAMIISALFNAKERFVVAQLAGCPMSLCVIAACFSGGGIQALGYAIAIGAALQMAILMPFTRDFGLLRPRKTASDGQVMELIKLASPAMMSMAANEINHMIDRTLGSTLAPGSVTSLNFSFKLITFALGVLIVPLCTVAYTRMSKCTAIGRMDVLSEVTATCLETLLMLLLPITALCVMLRGEIIGTVYGRGAFDAQAVVRTAGSFACYALGLTFFGMRDLLNRVFNALKSTMLPMVSACITVAANIALNLALIKPMGANGLALATAISGVLGCVVLCVMLKGKIHKLPIRRLTSQAARMLCAVCAMVAAMWVMSRAMGESAYAPARLIALSGMGSAVYVLTAIVLRVGAIWELMAILRNNPRQTTRS